MIITISGDLGSGKSTVAKFIAKKLNLNHYSSGDFVRNLAKEQGMSLKEFGEKAEQGKELDNKIDAYVESLGKSEDNFIIDSRLAWNFIPHSFKVYLRASPEVAAQRIFRQKRTDENAQSQDDMLNKIKQRRASEEKRYKEYYDISINDESNYDLVIDTNNLTAEEVAQKILDSLPK